MASLTVFRAFDRKLNMAEPQQEDLQNEAVPVQPLELDDEASSHANAKKAV